VVVQRGGEARGQVNSIKNRPYTYIDFRRNAYPQEKWTGKRGEENFSPAAVTTDFSATSSLDTGTSAWRTYIYTTGIPRYSYIMANPPVMGTRRNQSISAARDQNVSLVRIIQELRCCSLLSYRIIILYITHAIFVLIYIYMCSYLRGWWYIGSRVICWWGDEVGILLPSNF